MSYRILFSIIALFTIVNFSVGQVCCGEEIIKLEKKLGRKFDSFERINSIPKDGEVSSMREVFYLVNKKSKHGIINGERELIYGTYWEGIELISDRDPEKMYTFFSYVVEGKTGLGSVEYGLHLPAEYADVRVEIINDSSTICLMGDFNGGTRIDWLHLRNGQWQSKGLEFEIEEIKMYRRESKRRYGLYDDIVFFNGKSQAAAFELISGEPSISGPIGYIGVVKVDKIESPSLLCFNYETGQYHLMNPGDDGKLATTFRYNEPIISGEVIEEGIIIAKTAKNQYKLPLGKYSEDFQLASYDELYHSDQNLFLVTKKQLVVVNRHGSRQVVIRDYYKPDPCGNYHPEIHLTEEEESFFGHPIRSLEGSLFVTREGVLLNDSLYLMKVLDSRRCLYLFWEDEYRVGIMGKAVPKNKRGVVDGQGKVLLQAEYSAIWKKGKYFLTMKGGRVSSMILTPTLYEDGEWILYDSDFNPIKSPVPNAEFRTGGIIEKNGFTVDDVYYTTFDFTKKFFGVGVYEP